MEPSPGSTAFPAEGCHRFHICAVFGEPRRPVKVYVEWHGRPDLCLLGNEECSERERVAPTWQLRLRYAPMLARVVRHGRRILALWFGSGSGLPQRADRNQKT